MTCCYSGWSYFKDSLFQFYYCENCSKKCAIEIKVKECKKKRVYNFYVNFRLINIVIHVSDIFNINCSKIFFCKKGHCPTSMTDVFAKKLRHRCLTCWSLLTFYIQYSFWWPEFFYFFFIYLEITLFFNTVEKRFRRIWLPKTPSLFQSPARVRKSIVSIWI